MEYFYSGGGNNRPDFTYRFLMRKITDEMYDWCAKYPANGPFERWHIIHNYQITIVRRHIDKSVDSGPTIPLIQFESRKAAYLFRIAFSEYIIEDKTTYNFVKDENW